MKGSSTGSEPAASSMCSQRTRCSSPSAVFTSTVLPSRMRAKPLMTCTSFFLSSAPTPPVRRLTMPSFQPTVRSMSIEGAAAEMPSGESPA